MWSAGVSAKRLTPDNIPDYICERIVKHNTLCCSRLFGCNVGRLCFTFLNKYATAPSPGKDAKVRPVRSYEDRLRDGLKEFALVRDPGRQRVMA